VPVYDPKTGEPKTRIRIERDNRGNIIRQYEETIMDEQNPRIDGWFLCIAPLENPQLAMAVIVEGGGYGSKSAAPIAAALVLKARDLGYFKGAPAGTTPTPRPQARQRRAPATQTPPN
jgi:penicillin-binding protein 2